MGQSATFYSISQSIFQQYKEADTTDIYQYSDESITLVQTHIGINNILLKTFPQKADTINELFNPSTYLGSIPDFDDEEADFDAILDKPPVYYLIPEKVKEVNLVLAKITYEQISENYSADEFNKNEVYPEAWNNSSDPDIAFNLRNLLEDIDQLKNLTSKAAIQNNYLVLYIG